MGKHNQNDGHTRPARDFYPTPSWVVTALTEHVALAGLRIWEPACGDGRMSEALKAAGARAVFSTDVEDRGYTSFDRQIDFLSRQKPKWRFDAIITNPPGGLGNRTAVEFIEIGLSHLPDGGLMALLLPIDFDSGVTRSRFFGACPEFFGKIVLLRRIKWFEHPGKKEGPKENHCWAVWKKHREPRTRRPIIMYAPRHNGGAA